jgi:hypothetical protein
MVARSWHSRGVGRWLLLTCLHHLCQMPGVQIVTLETSQHVTGFYRRVGGFSVQETTENGYAPGLHKVAMRLEMIPEACTAIAQQLSVLCARLINLPSQKGRPHDREQPV